MFLISDILSVFPSFGSDVSEDAQVGEKTPDANGRIKLPLQPPHPLLLYFPRHCGCPFAERDIHRLVSLVLTTPSRFESLQILVIPHASSNDSKQWFAAVLHAAFEAFQKENPSSRPDTALLNKYFALCPDPSRLIAKAYGLGSLPAFSDLFSKDVLNAAGSLRSQGITNRATAAGSDRWATHGACGADSEGIVKFFWKAQTAAEEGQWEEAFKTLGY